MENFFSTGTQEFASTHPTRAKEKDNTYGFRRVLSAGVIDQQPISKDRVNGKRGMDEGDDAALYDFYPVYRRGTMWKIYLAVLSTVPRAFLRLLLNRRFIPRVPLFLRY